MATNRFGFFTFLLISILLSLYLPRFDLPAINTACCIRRQIDAKIKETSSASFSVFDSIVADDLCATHSSRTRLPSHRFDRECGRCYCFTWQVLLLFATIAHQILFLSVYVNVVCPIRFSAYSICRWHSFFFHFCSMLLRFQDKRTY